ncbi:MAG: bacterial transcriptional activator domain-containing protein [Phycisphaerae bacterium]|jgi:tetratricopeptide (TPR) repeat protein
MRTKLSVSFLLLAGVAFLMFICSCDNKTGEVSITDKPIAAFQKKLLDVAFETATGIPVKPHIKDRSRTQAAVVETCLKLEQPKLASSYIEKIDNWQRGLCYANLAFYCAKSGLKKEALHYIELAGKIAEQDHGQEWRNNRIKAKMAQTQTQVGQAGKADMLMQDLADSNSDEQARVQAKIDTEAPFEELVKSLDGAVSTNDFTMVRYALEVYARLFNRFYGDETRRSMIEEKIKTSWVKIPVIIRMELLFELTDFALKHSDQKKAIEFVNDGNTFLDDGEWRLEHRVALIAKLSELRSRAGDIDKARADTDAALVLFNDKKNEIVNIYRAEAVRCLAQAYKSMGDTEASLSVYKQAVEEGVENPNSRPRAEDLSATCCSMALYAVEPDAELWTRIYQISEGLGKSW